MIKKFICFLLIVSSSLSLSGCKGSAELNEIHIVHSVAIDVGEKEHIRVTAEIARLTAGGQQPKGMQNKTFLLSVEGETLFEAARRMRLQSDRTLLWGHTTVIIFSKQVAKKGIETQIDGIRRSRQIRNRTLIYVTEGKAYDTLKLHAPSGSISSQAIRGLSEGGVSTAMTEEVRLIDVYRELENGFRDITIPSIQEEQDAVQSNNQLLHATGLYAFKGERLVGLMNIAETKAYLRAMNKMEGSIENITCGKKKIITFENINNQSKVRAYADAEKKPHVHIKLNMDLNITSLGCSEIVVTPDSIHSWEKQLNASIENEVRQLIAFTQRYKSDLLGIGERIHRRQPKVWKQIKEEWERIYPTIEWTIEIHSRIDHSNFIS